MAAMNKDKMMTGQDLIDAVCNKLQVKGELLTDGNILIEIRKIRYLSNETIKNIGSIKKPVKKNHINTMPNGSNE